MRRCLAKGVVLTFLGGCYHPPAALRPDAEAPRPAPSTAADSAPARPRGCDASLAVLLDRAPLLRAARQGAAVGRADVAAAGAWDAPEIRAGDNLRDFGQESEIALRLRLPGLGVPGAETSAAEARAVLSAAEVRALEVEFALEARLAHAELRRATRHARLARAAAADAARRLELLGQRLQAGTATAVSHAAARLESATATDVADAADRRALRLASLWAARTGAPPLDGDRCAPPAGTPDVAATHPAIAAARAEAWEADAAAFAERRGQWIWPTFVQLGWVEDSAGGQRRDRIQLQFGIALPLPGQDAGDLATAEAEHKRAVADATVDATRSAVRAAHADYEAAVEDRSRLDARRADVDAAAALLARGEAAGASPDELASLAKRLRDHEDGVIEADYAVDVAAAELAAALGLAAGP